MTRSAKLVWQLPRGAMIIYPLQIGEAVVRKERMDGSFAVCTSSSGAITLLYASTRCELFDEGWRVVVEEG